MAAGAHENDAAADSVAANGDLSNARFGEFLLLRRLGSGGMADVYLAQQTSLDRSVAVKVLKSDAIAGASASGQGNSSVLLKRFEQEARAAGGLNHPNIVQVITTGRENGVSYIVQEYVPGLNLSQWIRRNGCPDYPTGLGWMRQVAAALRAAAEAGIVHRDIKPENVMITRDSVAKITDFGLATLSLQPEQKMNLTQVGTTMGTPWYMSPEQIQGEKVDHRSDEYSFGIMSYHMFAGRPPFPGRNAVTVAVQHLKEDPEPLESLRPDLPLPMCDVIRRMISKKAVDRYQTTEELVQVLNDLPETPSVRRRGLPLSMQNLVDRWIPGWKLAMPAVVASCLGAWVAAGGFDPPLELPPPSIASALPHESSAARQFAVAIMNARNPDAWKSVISHFPNTEEADLAQLHLAISYLAPPLPDYESATEEFRNVEDSGRLDGRLQRQIQGIVGRAYVLAQKGDTDGARKVISDARSYPIDEDLSRASEEDWISAVNSGPVELREFWWDRRDRTGDAPN